ncbi:response regulator [Pontiellaceae bacterium B1224]|nr:response regulator [Pontiellaceae bacterium B1224]
MAKPVPTILFIEPDKYQQQIFAEMLKSDPKEWKLTIAESSFEALSMVENQFDFMMTVNKLPDGNGQDLCDRFKAVAPETVRYLLIDPEERKLFRSLISSAQQIITKPLDLETFKIQLMRSTALRDIIENKAIRKLLGHADSFPPLPRVFAELSQKLNNLDTPLLEISDLISKDITISTKVLQLANSALFNQHIPANTLSHATSLLGSKIISSLVFSQSISDMFKSALISEQFLETLNQHSLEVAGLAADILQTWHAGPSVIEKVLLCGIAHDLGQLILAKYAPEKWLCAQNELRKNERSIVETEREIIGVAHPELAAYLLAIWGFPSDQVMAIAHHHEPSKTKDVSLGLLCALHIAENCCQTAQDKEQFDWPYLEKCHITHMEITNFKLILEAKRSNRYAL